MASKIEDFTRVNGPRVGHALEWLEVVARSAKSRGVTDDDHRALLLPLHEYLAELFGEAPEAASPKTLFDLMVAYGALTVERSK